MKFLIVALSISGERVLREALIDVKVKSPVCRVEKVSSSPFTLAVIPKGAWAKVMRTADPLNFALATLKPYGVKYGDISVEVVDDV
jgi:hypothetical protein